jgi:hypothetical protein
MRIGAYVLAIVLLGAPAIRASLAAEQRSGTRDVAGSNLPVGSSGDRALSRSGDHHPPAATGAGPKSDGNSDVKEGRAIRGETAPQSDARAGPKGDGIKAPNGVEDHSVAKDFRSSPAGGRGADAVDTRITVVPRRADRKSDTVQDARTKSKVGVRATVHGRPILHPGAPELARRNAIGLPVAQRGNPQRRSGEPQELTGQNSKLSGLNMGQSRVGPRLTEPEPGRFTVNPARSATSVPAAVSTGGKINGTGLIRPGGTAFGIGGPARPAAGINGTMITSKH